MHEFPHSAPNCSTKTLRAPCPSTLPRELGWYSELRGREDEGNKVCVEGRVDTQIHPPQLKRSPVHLSTKLPAVPKEMKWCAETQQRTSTVSVPTGTTDGPSFIVTLFATTLLFTFVPICSFLSWAYVVSALDQRLHLARLSGGLIAAWRQAVRLYIHKGNLCHSYLVKFILCSPDSILCVIWVELGVKEWSIKGKHKQKILNINLNSKNNSRGKWKLRI